MTETLGKSPCLDSLVKPREKDLRPGMSLIVVNSTTESTAVWPIPGTNKVCKIHEGQKVTLISTQPPTAAIMVENTMVEISIALADLRYPPTSREQAA